MICWVVRGHGTSCGRLDTIVLVFIFGVVNDFLGS